MTSAAASRSTARGNLALLIAIFGLGLVLRLWGLGANFFWVDELGVAQAAFQPTLALTLQAAHGHIMAMPLDYVTAFFMAHLSHGEGWLRLPEALWGSLTLLAGWALYRELSASSRIALLGTLLTALSPILIEYSQELRFYAPLTFFFTLCLYLGLRAVERSRLRDWALFTTAVLVGVYFHFYVILVLGNVVLWLLITYRAKLKLDHRLLYAVGATIIGSVAFLIGLSAFGSVFATPIPLFLYETFPSFVFVGLGWLPPFPVSPAGWAAGFVSLGLAAIGLAVQLRRGPASRSCVLFYTAVLQVALIIALDLVKNYFVSARQVLMLVPVMCYFSACGADWIIERIAAQRPGVASAQTPALLVGAALVLISLPILQDYYRLEKGSALEILETLSSRWQTGELIYIQPDYTLEAFAYYAPRAASNSTFVNAMKPADFGSSAESGWQSPGSAWLVTSYPPGPSETAVRAAGFLPAWTPPEAVLYPQMLWQRP